MAGTDWYFGNTSNTCQTYLSENSVTVSYTAIFGENFIHTRFREFVIFNWIGIWFIGLLDYRLVS